MVHALYGTSYGSYSATTYNPGAGHSPRGSLESTDTNGGPIRRGWTGLICWVSASVLVRAAQVTPLAYYMLKKYDDALPLLRDFVSLAPNHPPGHLWLASTYAQTGELEKARAQAAEVLRIDPNWSIRKFEPLGPFKRPEDAMHFFDGMRKAGLPEG